MSSVKTVRLHLTIEIQEDGKAIIDIDNPDAMPEDLIKETFKFLAEEPLQSLDDVDTH